MSSIESCPHPAKRKTLVGSRALCGKCFRKETDRPVRFCRDCGARAEDIHSWTDRLLTDNGRDYCGRCRRKRAERDDAATARMWVELDVRAAARRGPGS